MNRLNYFYRYFYIILLISFSQITQGQNSFLRFRHLTYDDGLKNTLIHSIAQDRQGFIWFGTEDGLYRYDGFRLRVFKSNPKDTNSLNSSSVFSLLPQADGKIWVGTYRGVMIYDESTEQFTDLKLSDKFLPGQTVPVNDLLEVDNEIWIGCQDIGVLIYDKAQKGFNNEKAKIFNRYLTDCAVNCMFVDSKKNTWIGTNFKGLLKFEPGKYEPVKYDYSSIKPSMKFDCSEILNIFESGKGEIWISTRSCGVYLLANGKEITGHFVHNLNNNKSLGSNEVYDFREDKEGNIWISTHGGGLNIYNRSTNDFTRIKHKTDDKYSLLNDNIRKIFEDKQGNLWLSSYQAGVNILINSPYQFNHFYFSPDANTEYKSSTTLSFFAEKDVLWVGTDGGGLKKINRKTGNISTFLPGNTQNNLSDRVIMTIYSDYQGTLWLGTYLGGLVKFNPLTSEFKSYRHIPGNSKSISSDFVTTILEDTKGNFWLGTNGGGINLFDKTTGIFTSFRKSVELPEKSLVDDHVTIIREDNYGDLWIGTYWGLSRFNVRDFSFTNYLTSGDKLNGISDNVILSILNDSKGHLWIGTRMGLNLYNRSSDSFTIFTESDGLAGNTINGLLEDGNGNIWIATNNGITKLNPQTSETINFYTEDGLQGNEFYHGACYKTQSGEMFFGGFNGFNSFFPDSINLRYYEPDVVITNMLLFDKDVPIGKMTDGRTILTKNISHTQKIKLKYSDKSISFAFAAIDYIEGRKSHYAYKLEGFDEEWHLTSNEYPFANYTNLGPGHYKLLVKSGRKELVNKSKNITSLDIVISPPIWRTWWAYVIYLLVFTSLVYYFWNLSIQRVKDKNQAKLEKLRREQIESITHARMSFYANISHEIRTPLTLIIGPLEQLISRGKDVQNIRKQLDIMLKNARRMLRLINQLLDFRRIEMQKMALNAENADIVQFIRDITSSFEEFAQEKSIELKFITSVNNCLIWFDPDKVDKIVYNLLSNAFKYTPDNGKISVALKTNVSLKDKINQQFVEISVSDTGQGIPPKDLERIFERFFQGHTFANSIQQGWGIGLNLTRSLTEVHRGEIRVESVEKQGSTFRVYLPMGDLWLEESEKVQNGEPGLNKYLHLDTESYGTEKENRVHEKTIKQNAFEVLIVEDNVDLRNYLAEELECKFNCFEASNGKEGYEMAVEIMPDIIVSDVMMKGMDGIQLCKNIKENIITSHIPVILLTAKATIEDQIKGYESGADAYLSKPFSPDQLIASINSIIENRQRLKQKFGMLKDYSKRSLTNTADDKFLTKISEIINNNLSDNLFGVNELAIALEISRVHLHRKMKAITDTGPNEFIRKIRLQKAAELLLANELSISEICNQTGFSSTTYFSSCFKAYYNVTPREFVDRVSG